MSDHNYDPSNPNSGHSHVFPRPDGLRARCTALNYCPHCQEDQRRKKALTAVSTSDEVGVPNVEMWQEDFNKEANQDTLSPGTEDVRSPGVNRIAQPNLNNSLIGSLNLEAVRRLLGTSK